MSDESGIAILISALASIPSTVVEWSSCDRSAGRLDMQGNPEDEEEQVTVIDSRLDDAQRWRKEKQDTYRMTLFHVSQSNPGTYPLLTSLPVLILVAYRVVVQRGQHPGQGSRIADVHGRGGAV